MPTNSTAYLDDMLFETQLGSHNLKIDVPPAMGGNDRGPTPPELFVASLGSCVGAFVARYCQRSGIDTSEMTVDVSFDKVENPKSKNQDPLTLRQLSGPRKGAAAGSGALPGA